MEIKSEINKGWIKREINEKNNESKQTMRWKTRGKRESKMKKIHWQNDLMFRISPHLFGNLDSAVSTRLAKGLMDEASELESP
jgi:hypothetical protein